MSSVLGLRLAADVRDALARFQRDLSRSKSLNTRSIFDAFTRSLVAVWPRRPFRCGWEAPGTEPVALRQKAARPQSMPAGHQLVQGLQPRELIPQTPYTIQHYARGGATLAATTTLDDDGSTLTLVLEPTDETGSDPTLGSSLFSSVIDLCLLHASLSAALTANGRTAVGRMRAAAHERRSPLIDRLRRIATIWDDTQSLEGGREAAVWLVQELLGTGWKCAELADKAFREALSGFVTRLRSTAPRIDRASLLTHEALSRLTHVAAVETLAALLRPKSPRAISRTRFGAAPTDDRDAFALASVAGSLAAWTHAQAVARKSLTSRDDATGVSNAQAEHAHRAFTSAARTSHALWNFVELELRYASVLARRRKRTDHSPGAHPRRPAEVWEGETTPRALAVLWFCLGLLDRLTPAPASAGDSERRSILDELAPPACVALLADYAYVMRECVRVLCFGRRSDFVAQDAALASALATVVRYHAEHVVGLSSRYEVGEALRRLGAAEGLNRGAQPTEHLRHALETYLCGHLILDLCAAPAGAAHGAPAHARLADALSAQGTARAGSASGQSLRQAFSLCALLHDLGYLLFPMNARPARALTERDARLARAFEHLDQKLADAAAAFVPDVVSTLLDARYCDSANEPDLARWLDRQRASPRPDHGLLSAYFLHHVCARVPGGDPAVQRQAVRATLLHNTSLPIAMQADPAAGLLVLCNELFEWEPERSRRPAPSAVDTAFHVMVSEAGYLPLRHRALGLPLTLAPAAHDGLRRCIGVRGVASGQTPARPAVLDVHLREPRFLDAPVYHLWLLKAQRLGRVKDHPAWAARLRLHVPRDSRLHPRTMREVLEQAVGRLRSPFQGALEEWLRVLRHAGGGQELTRRRPLDGETVWLGPETQFAPDVDLGALLVELDREVDALFGRRS